MRQEHYPTLKFHTIFSLVIASVFVVMMLLMRDIALGLALLFLFLYITGNGIIHSKNNKLTRDTLMEYILVSLVILVIIIDVLL